MSKCEAGWQKAQQAPTFFFFHACEVPFFCCCCSLSLSLLHMNALSCFLLFRLFFFFCTLLLSPKTSISIPAIERKGDCHCKVSLVFFFFFLPLSGPFSLVVTIIPYYFRSSTMALSMRSTVFFFFLLLLIYVSTRKLCFVVCFCFCFSDSIIIITFIDVYIYMECPRVCMQSKTKCFFIRSEPFLFFACARCSTGVFFLYAAMLCDRFEGATNTWLFFFYPRIALQFIFCPSPLFPS